MGAKGCACEIVLFYHADIEQTTAPYCGAGKGKPFFASVGGDGTASSGRESRVHHIPVMAREATSALEVRAGGRYIDCTAGEGGHSLALLRAADPAPSVLCIDRDGQALAAARRRLGEYAGKVVFARANYADVARLAAEHGFSGADGALLDLGLSSLQLDVAERGFSFRQEAPLDMRFDARQRLTAHDIVNGYSIDKLADALYGFGEETRSRRIARAIARRRPVRTTTELADIVAGAAGGRRGRVHPATKTFQAIRIAVNGELDNLKQGLDGAIETLGANGRLAVITYHSIEDRIVKTALRRESADCVCPPELPECVCEHTAALRIVNRRVIKPTADEVKANPRSRSARLRVAARVG